ncbi:hypothetical protein G4Y73_03725 [Wenzhouxiangella sp. XN201]|uniref:DUF6165 family protein n=1 Tax=Wenzhouxiangella sp. XN201 TaxID=2710755 RepID=UPI0013CBBEE2|nr:DUF6165 family protein [Wenzhouxiangella sp. XN201]NEZ03256.1 hypothetical protein [Wenzhouxiangella sp. XN201]
MELLIPVSPGELLDKLAILEIKLERIDDAAKRAYIEREHALLSQVWKQAGVDDEVVAEFRLALRRVNEALWDIENAIRSHESRSDFGEDFVQLARSVYIRNDERAAIKKRINEALGSDIREEKSYSSYR